MNQQYPAPHSDDQWRNYIANSLRDTQQNVILLSQNLANLTGKVDDIGKSILLLARMEEREKAVAARLDDGKHEMEHMNKRISEIEQKVPGLLEARGWILAGVLGVVAIVGAAALSFLLRQS